ncbi:MAG: alpha/beta hydrolase [Dehalococcoidia bacterium]
MGAAQRRIPVNGLHLNVCDWDAGQRETICYFPVYTGNVEDAAEFANLVADRFRVVAIDPRGHGDSDWAPPDGYTPANYLADAQNAWDALDIGRCVLMGSSFGAATALCLAAAHPDRVRALVMDDQPPEMPVSGSGRSLTRTYQAQLGQRFNSLDEVVGWAKQFRVPAWGWELSDERLLAWAATATRTGPDGAIVWKHDPEILRGMAPFDGSPAADLRPLFARLKVPALLIRRLGPGAALPSPAWESLQALNPRVRYHTVADAGHPVILTRPRAFVDAVLAALDNRPLPQDAEFHQGL